MQIAGNKALWNEVKDYFFITLGLMLYAFGWTVFLLPYEIVTGGVTGIAAIIFYATRLPIEYSYFTINAVLLIIALKILGWRFMMKTIYAIFMISILLWVAQMIVIQPDGTFKQVLGKLQSGEPCSEEHLPQHENIRGKDFYK